EGQRQPGRVCWPPRQWLRIAGRTGTMSRPERALTRAWWACGGKQAETPEPKGKLDTVSGTPDALAPAPSPVNGPEDGFPGWDQVDWGRAEENVRRLPHRTFPPSQP